MIITKTQLNKKLTKVVKKISPEISKRFYPGNLFLIKPLLRNIPLILASRKIGLQLSKSLHLTIIKPKLKIIVKDITNGVIEQNHKSDQGYLPKTYTEYEQLSGLIMSPTSFHNSLLNMTDVKSIALRFEMTKYICKCIALLIRYKTTKDLLSKGIADVFCVIQPPKILYDMLGDRTLSFLQHCLIFIYGKYNYDYGLLKEIAGNINCESFVEFPVKILSFIELHFAKQLELLLLNNNITDITIYLINPDGTSNLDVYFCSIHSKERSGQKKADLILTKNNYNIINIKNTTINYVHKDYFDIKSYPTAGFKVNRFSMIFPDKTLMLKLFNDYITTLKKYITEYKLPSDNPIVDLYRTLITLKKLNKNIEITFPQATKKLLELLLNNNYNLPVSIVGILTQNDIVFDLLWQIIEERIKNKVTKDFAENLIKFFPQKPIINETESSQALKIFIIECFPEEFHKDLLVRLGIDDVLTIQ